MLVVYFPLTGCIHLVCVVVSPFAFFFPRKGSMETYNSVYLRTDVYLFSPSVCHLYHLDAGRR